MSAKLATIAKQRHYKFFATGSDPTTKCFADVASFETFVMSRNGVR